MSVILNEILRVKRLHDEENSVNTPDLDGEDEVLDDEEDLDSDDDMATDEDDDFSDLDDIANEYADKEDDLDLEGDEEPTDDIEFDDDSKQGFEDDEFTDIENAPREPGGNDQNGIEFDDQGSKDDFTGLDDDGEDDDQLDQQDNEEPADPNRAGVIRYVKGAHLVYKKEQEDGTYEEMWMYNSGKFKKDLETRKAILAGTDIPPNATQSPDGEQQLKMWSAGNADIVVITGLPQ